MRIPDFTRARLLHTGLLARITMLAAICMSLAACAFASYRSDPVTALRELPRILDTLQQMKTVSDIKRSFVFRASELLFPDGLNLAPEQLPNLSPAQYDQVDRFLSERIAAVQDLSKKLVESHPEFRALRVVPARFTRVKFLKTGQPEAVVDADGVLLIDVRIVQSILRSVIIHWERSGGLEADQGPLSAFALLAGPRRFVTDPTAQLMPADEERDAIGAFNRFRKEVDRAAPTMEIGLWLKLLKANTSPLFAGRSATPDPNTDHWQDALAHTMEAMGDQVGELSRLVAARYAQETFQSALDFVIAHEMGHRLFGHAVERDRRGTSSAASACDDWRRQELVADEFAAVLLAQRLIAESRSARVIQKPEGNERVGFPQIPSIDGGSLFLATAYRLATFGNRLVNESCSYPSIERRLADIGVVLDLAEEANERSLDYEGLMKGNSNRLRDNARIIEVMSESAASASPNANRQKVERALRLVGPIIEARYRGNI